MTALVAFIALCGLAACILLAMILLTLQDQIAYARGRQQPATPAPAAAPARITPRSPGRPRKPAAAPAPAPEPVAELRIEPVDPRQLKITP